MHICVYLFMGKYVLKVIVIPVIVLNHGRPGAWLGLGQEEFYRRCGLERPNARNMDLEQLFWLGLCPSSNTN